MSAGGSWLRSSMLLRLPAAAGADSEQAAQRAPGVGGELEERGGHDAEEDRRGCEQDPDERDLRLERGDRDLAGATGLRLGRGRTYRLAGGANDIGRLGLARGRLFAVSLLRATRDRRVGERRRPGNPS